MPFIPSPAAAPPPVEAPTVVPLGRFLLTPPPELALGLRRDEVGGTEVVRPAVGYTIGDVEVREFVLEEGVPEAIFVKDLWRRHLEEREGQLRERLYAHERAGFRLVPDAGARLPTARHSVLRQLNATVPEDLVWEGAYVREGVLLWLAAPAWRSDTKDTTGEVALLVESVAGAYRAVEVGAPRMGGGFHTLRGVIDLPPTLPERAGASLVDAAHAHEPGVVREDILTAGVGLGTIAQAPDGPSVGERMAGAFADVVAFFANSGVRRVRHRSRTVGGLIGTEHVMYMDVREPGAKREAGYTMAWASDGAAGDALRPEADVEMEPAPLPPSLLGEARRRHERALLSIWDALLDGLAPVEPAEQTR